MGEKQGSSSTLGVLPPTDPFTVRDLLRAALQIGLGGPVGGAAAAADLAARVAQAKRGAPAQSGSQNVPSTQRGTQASPAPQPSQSNGSGNGPHWWSRWTTPPPPTWTPPPPKPPALVEYNGHTVSDPRVREALEQISKYFASATVNVRSGDRNFRPRGSPANSPHLTHQAADIHVMGRDDSQVKDLLKDPSIASALSGLRILQHGPYTATEGPHIHIDSRRDAGQPARFMHEGMTRTGRNVYDDDDE